MFDTLLLCKQIISRKRSRKTSKVQAETLGELFEESEQHLATNSDLKAITVDIHIVTVEFENKIEELRRDMLFIFASVDVRFSEMQAELIK